MIYYITDRRILDLCLIGFAVGCALGSLWDIFGFFRCLFCGYTAPGRRLAKTAAFVYNFFSDIVFFITAALVNVLFIYASNNGKVRIVAILAELAGFTIWRLSAGALASRVSVSAVRIIYRVLSVLYMRTIVRLTVSAKKSVKKLKWRVLYARLSGYTVKYKKRSLDAAEHGFGLCFEK